MLTNIFADAGITITNVGYSNDRSWEAETTINDQPLLLEVMRSLAGGWRYYLYTWDDAWRLHAQGTCKDRIDGQRLCLDALLAMRSE